MPTRSYTTVLVSALAALALVSCGDASVGGPGRATVLRAASATLQSGRPDQLVPSGPTVTVTDPNGVPMPGITVEFEVTAGGGSAAPASGVSGANGRVQTAWRLGAPGAQEIRASSPGVPGASVVFRADAVDAGGGYRIELQFFTAATPAQLAAFQNAAARIEEVVVGALPPHDLTGRNCVGTPVSGTVESGVLILVRLEYIDGPFGILGEAGPCVFRTSGFPSVGRMRFDSSDLDMLEAQGRLEATMLHEMLHVLGFGIWDPPLLSGRGTVSSAFNGPAALEAAIGYNGAPASWASVPVENCVGSPPGCGAGTRDAHWREAVFGNELMTGWISGSAQPFSRTTIASLADLGYVVDLDAADPFDLGLATLRALDPFAPEPFPLGDDILRVPIENDP